MHRNTVIVFVLAAFVGGIAGNVFELVEDNWEMMLHGEWMVEL